MNSCVSIHILQSQRVVLLMGHKTDDSTATVRNGSLAQFHWQAADLSALLAQNDSPDRSDLDLYARLAALLKLQQIVMDRQCPAVVTLCIFKSEQMCCA